MSPSHAVSAHPAAAIAPVPLDLPLSRQGSESHGGWEAGLSATGPVLQFAQDREIYAEGDDAVSFFKIVSGVVRICTFLSDGRRRIDGFRAAGDIFGFEPGSTYRLSAEAVCDCTVIVYRRRGVERLAASNAALSQQLFAHAMHNMARAQDHVLLLWRKSAAEKVAGFLLEWAEHAPDRGTITLEMTRQDIADYLGVTIETVSRTLSQLERDAVIELVTLRQLRVRNPNALRALNA